MDLEPRILNLFEDHLMATQQAIEFISPAISKAAENIVQTLVSDGKIVICGSGEGMLIAKRLFDTLTFGMERERPALPAYLLSNDMPDTSNLSAHSDMHRLSHQIRALGQAGDTLIVITSDGNSTEIKFAVESAKEKGISVIALTGRDGGSLAEYINDDDIEIRVPSASIPRVSEVHWFVAHCLIDLIDNMLFGTEN